MNFSAKSTRFEHIALGAIMFAAALLRLWHAGLAPGSGALNLDEAYSAYEAYDWFKHNNMHVEQFGTFLVGTIDDQGTRR